MRIGIDYSAALPDERAGIGNYTYQLVHALSRVDHENEYLLYPNFYSYFLNKRRKEIDIEASNFSLAFKRFPLLLPAVLWPPFVPRGVKDRVLGDVDVVHSTTYCAPRFKDRKKRLVVTIYDLTVLTNPECHKKMNIRHCMAGIKGALEYADGIIAISEHTKADLISHLNAPPELITVTHLAAGEAYREVEDPAALHTVARKYGLPENYILFVGSLEPRKNVRALLKAYSMLPERLKKEFYLVIAGGKGWLNSDIPASVKDLGIGDRVKFAGYIDTADIAAVYSGAALFAYPSLYEGFGLPVLEAMSCGTPVVTSDTSSMPEVAGGAAVLVSPHSAEGIAGALSRVLESSEARREMREKGLKRAALFSWERCARETLAVYRKVVESGRR